ncbi:PREDICTED: anoctamin-4-like isoform X2 [Priapulus caudatus]|uniref:Anoctamin n=1 Tax=Priapulus caudatus TaxID=37621 RepID=A0ABM1DS18_PRICU|nr:PREDICTED: anoctamin-4-like isoform X2 [Priapulus caudatus]
MTDGGSYGLATPNQPGTGFEMAERSSPVPIGFEGVGDESYPPSYSPPEGYTGGTPMHPGGIPPAGAIPDSNIGRENPAFGSPVSGSGCSVNEKSVTNISYGDPVEQGSLGALITENSNNKPHHDRREQLYFNDGKRQIDFILAYNDDDPKKEQKRQRFIASLHEEGLMVEVEDASETNGGRVSFVKIHAPWEVCTRYAELMNMKMPIKEILIQALLNHDEQNDLAEDEESQQCLPKMPNPFEISEETLPEEPNYFTAAFNRERSNQFIIDDHETFFSHSQRTRIVYEVLSRARYDDSNKLRFGIIRMLDNDSYTAAFSLHEGSYSSEHSVITHGYENERRLLYELWAKPKAFYKQQPLDLIRKYYGEKVGIYFAWLGFYTIWLVPASLVGMVCFLYGCFTLYKNIPSNEICEPGGLGSTVMCPLCDQLCPFWELKSSCFYSRLTYLFDNPATVFFSIFMSLWGTLFLEFWKRKQHVIAWDWDVLEYEQEQESLRPQYEAQASHKKTNPITKLIEPYIPWWNKATRVLTSATTILFMLCVVLAAIFGVIVYRIVIVSVLYASDVALVRQNAKLTTTITAATLNLLVIILLSKIYRWLAIWLTNIECPRTQSDYEDSFTFKMFLFQFVNFYSSLFYIAFFKGRFMPPPGEDKKAFYVLEQCDPAGCLIELCIQLGIIMVGKQFLNNFMELGLPFLMNFIRKKKSNISNESTKEQQASTRWEQDYVLAATPPLGLFDEYLEMVIQFGFVTLFVAAFPLAPLFALLNNVIEIRLDAFKYVTQLRRPLAARAQDIGAWYNILKALSILSVISNAFVIAYTSDFIPRLVYLYAYSGDEKKSVAGYINGSLSYFDVKDFLPTVAPDPNLEANKELNGTEICRYRGYNYPPGHPKQYHSTIQHWHIVAARFIFVVVFEHVVFFLTSTIAVFIPDEPGSVRDQILREKFLAKEALYAAELQKTKTKREDDDEETASAKELEGGGGGAGAEGLRYRPGT